MTNSEDPDHKSDCSLIRVFIVLSVVPVLMVYNTLKIMCNILREKYFDIVSEG